MSFETLGLSVGLLRAVADQGYREPTPVQRQAIPVILQGRDILAGAQTGTGKTVGFTLPLLQRLGAMPRANGRRGVRALILTPTRELAAQVQQSVRTYGRHPLLRDIEHLLKRELPRVVIAGHEPDPAIRAEPIANDRGGGNPRGGARRSSKSDGAGGNRVAGTREAGGGRIRRDAGAAQHRPPPSREITRRASSRTRPV